MAWAVNSMDTLDTDKVVYLKGDKQNVTVLNKSQKGGVLQKYPSRTITSQRESKCSNITDQDVMDYGE